MSHLINIFLEPGKVFADLKEKPTFALPLILVIVAAMAMTFMYFSKVDSQWYTDYIVMQSGKEMSQAEIAQMRSVMPSAKVMGYISTISTPIVLVIVSLILALYYFIAGKVTGTATSFKHSLSLTAWAGMPTLLSMIVALIGVFNMVPETAIESLMMTRLDPLLFDLPVDSPWKRLASSFDLLSLWGTFLAALGWKTWGKTSWAEAITVAVIPSLIVYGGMAVWALI